MSDNKLKLLRKGSIVIHLLSFAFFVVAMNFKLRYEPGSWLNISGTLSLGLWMLTFYFAFNRSGIGKFLTYKVDKLDERELVDYHRALRFAYWVFVFLVLALVMVYALTQTKIQIYHAIIMLYIAHILPGVYLGWKMK